MGGLTARILRRGSENRKVLWQTNASLISDLAEPRLPYLTRHCIPSSHLAMSRAESSTNQPTKEDAIPGLGVLEEDDEFEEFPIQGKCAHPKPLDPSLTRLSQLYLLVVYTFKTSDWDDTQTDLANLSGAGSAGSAAGGDKLWEDNWDDDDIEEEFSTQLRFVPSHPNYICYSYPRCYLSGRNSKRQNRAQTRCSIDRKPESDGLHLKPTVALPCVQTNFIAFQPFLNNLRIPSESRTLVLASCISFTGNLPSRLDSP